MELPPVRGPPVLAAPLAPAPAVGMLRRPLHTVVDLLALHGQIGGAQQLGAAVAGVAHVAHGVQHGVAGEARAVGAHPHAHEADAGTPAQLGALCALVAQALAGVVGLVDGDVLGQDVDVATGQWAGQACCEHAGAGLGVVVPCHQCHVALQAGYLGRGLGGAAVGLGLEGFDVTQTGGRPTADEPALGVR